MKNILLFIPLLVFSAFAQISDLGNYYDTLKSEDLVKIETLCDQLSHAKRTFVEKARFGALLMKKSGLLKGRGEKLKVFKEGRSILEEQISANPKNLECRFLRLIIQEHAPGILGYNKNKEEDKVFILDHFSNVEKELQLIIKDYALGSKVLNF